MERVENEGEIPTAKVNFAFELIKIKISLFFGFILDMRFVSKISSSKKMTPDDEAPVLELLRVSSHFLFTIILMANLTLSSATF